MYITKLSSYINGKRMISQEILPNKNMHSDKIKLRSFLTTLYFAGDVKRYVSKDQAHHRNKM